jgi:hypothetical protein
MNILNEVLIPSTTETLRLVIRIGPMLFVSIFGIELLMQMGLMKKLEPLGRPLTRISHLPPQSTLTFLTAIGSIFAANTMLMQFRQDNKLTDRQVVLSAILNVVPFHIKETFTFHFPVVLPLLGLKICLVYVATFLLAGLFKMLFVVIAGRMFLRPGEECDLDPDGCGAPPSMGSAPDQPLKQRMLHVWKLRRRLFTKIMTIFISVTLVVQVLIQAGIMRFFENLVAPVMHFFSLPGSMAAPVSIYIFTPAAGLTYMSNLLQERLVSEYHVILAILLAGYIMIPISRLRGTLPRYSAIFGLKVGGRIVAITTTLSLLARTVVLVGVWLCF